MEEKLEKQTMQLTELQTELDFYKRLNPEVAIFYRKKSMAKNLLKISMEDLKKASEQSWYEEYIALLSIRLENPTLCFMGKEFVKELTLWYKEKGKVPERNLAVLGMLQFM